MGRLNLQDGAIVYVDSAIFIYTLQSDQRYFSILNAFWEKFQSRMRSIKRMKTPDAIHASTAVHHGCTVFFTNDRFH